MLEFICTACKGKQYSSTKTNTPCIYCGKEAVILVGPAGGSNESKER